MLDDRADGPQRRAAATILARRGNLRGARVVFEEYPSDTLVDEYVARGAEGIRIVCSAASRCGDASHRVASRLAALREVTGATVYAIAGDPACAGELAAICVLGHWDELQVVETLMQAAEDPLRRREVREEALRRYASSRPPRPSTCSRV